ncbi:hypothetical protein GJAV_G00074320 [Gymnothorax javanicus]|nr:hypothetical protein GJAV_G00074320 [Gymnothorax javanicus]
MFSDSRQLGPRRVLQREGAPHRWLHNSVMVHRENARAGPSTRTDAGPLSQDAGRESGLASLAEAGNSHLMRERNATNSDGWNLQSRLLLDEQKQIAQPERVWASQSGLRDTRWNQAPEPGQRHTSPEREPLVDYSCSSHCYQKQPHPSGRKYVPPPPSGFKGQESYGVPSYGGEKQAWGYARESYRRGFHVSWQANTATRRFIKQRGSSSGFVYGQEHCNYNHGLSDLDQARNGKDQNCNGPSSTPGLIFSNEVPHRMVDNSRHRSLCWPSSNMTHVQNQSPGAGQGQKSDLGASRPKISQTAVRDQIRQVVVDLEGVLGGLKQVHLEMKEVVQQIDLLTSNIDLGEDDPSTSLPSDTLCSSSSSGVMVSSHGGPRSHRLKPASPLWPSNRSPPAWSNATALNPSVVATSQAAAAMSISGDFHQDRTCASPTMGVPSLKPPRDQSREAQSRRVQLRPTRPKSALHCRNQLAVQGPGITTCGNKKPPPYPHNGQVAKGGAVDGIYGLWSSRRDGPSQLEEKPENLGQQSARMTLDDASAPRSLVMLKNSGQKD